MPVACPRCGAFVQQDAPSCRGCGYALAPAATTFLNLSFPPEHPEYDFSRPDNQWPAPAPTLMPSQQPIPDLPPIPPQVPARKTLAAVVGAVAVVVVAGVVAAAVLLGGETEGTSAAAPAGADSGSSAQQPAAPEPEPTTTTPPPDPVPTDEKSARQMLANQVASDHASVEAVTEQWVPQLSSKRFGLKANGTVYNYRAIWADFTRLTTEHPGAMLLWSGDYRSFKLPNFWVTIAPASYGTGEEANGWCDTAGIDRDNCYAKRITHTGSYADSTLLR